jgi:hypothetical protein
MKRQQFAAAIAVFCCALFGVSLERQAYALNTLQTVGAFMARGGYADAAYCLTADVWNDQISLSECEESDFRYYEQYWAMYSDHTLHAASRSGTFSECASLLSLPPLTWSVPNEVVC